MQKVLQGIHHFQSNVFSSHQELFRRLAAGQHPEALFITCSDSRINLNLLTQTDPGDLFILRNAGNLIPAYDAVGGGGERATVEFALVALHVRDIIVCGHSHCGAMKALLEPQKLGGLPAMADWLAHAEPTRLLMRDKYRHLGGEALHMATIEENVLAQVENLRTHPAVADGIAAGDLKLHGWIYQIETGQVLAYDPAYGQFVPLPAAALQSVPPLSAIRPCSADHRRTTAEAA
jgi:carbonic anhydrase